VIIPLFAWIFSEWCLFVFGPLYIYLSIRTEDASWLEREVSEQFSEDEIASLSPTTASASSGNASFLSPASNMFGVEAVGAPGHEVKGPKYDPVINQLHLDTPV
jgi:hypothetical protein